MSRVARDAAADPMLHLIALAVLVANVLVPVLDLLDSYLIPLGITSP